MYCRNYLNVLNQEFLPICQTEQQIRKKIYVITVFQIVNVIGNLQNLSLKVQILTHQCIISKEFLTIAWHIAQV